MDTPARDFAEGAFHWIVQPAAAAFIRDTVERFLADCPPAQRLADQMRSECGTRFIDWIDHIAVAEGDALPGRLTGLGFVKRNGAASVWTHPQGMFPTVRLVPAASGFREVAIKVESVTAFLIAHGRDDVAIDGAPLSSLRRARIASYGDTVLSIVERHGDDGFEAPDMPAAAISSVLRHAEAFLRRRRRFANADRGFAHARQLIAAAVSDLGADRTADLFFAAERSYWMGRNRAAQVQKARQDRLGLGWANHDHHTYRSSREHFATSIAVFETLGLRRRERFYAGDAAGWGAQILEQPVAGIVVFADVDLSPDEVAGDFAHEPLSPRDRLGTVGLWCGLHGEAFLEAGMHHLECQFDFATEREQLDRYQVASMKPFTLFPYLKQAFTEAEVWPVDAARLGRLLSQRLITAEQAEKFAREGAVGSHLEVLQRDDGYKGFNQAGISEIIHRTDPRHAPAAKIGLTAA